MQAISLHSGQQGALSFPTLVPWPLFWATPPHPQIGTHASSRVTGCPVGFLRAGVSGLVRTVPKLLTLSTQQLPVLVQVSQKEAVDKSRLPQAGLTWP